MINVFNLHLGKVSYTAFLSIAMQQQQWLPSGCLQGASEEEPTHVVCCQEQKPLLAETPPARSLS